MNCKDNKIIVGYGSLLFTDGWNKTLKRVINKKDLIYTEIGGYKRVWSYTTLINSLNDGKKYGGVFLDIEKDKKCFINAFGVVVKNEEFDYISLREKAYNMIDITKNIKNPLSGYTYFTAYLKDKNKKCIYDKVIPKKYYIFIENNLKLMDKDFVKKYKSTTFGEEKFKFLEGEYIFLDKDINKHTGRDSLIK